MQMGAPESQGSWVPHECWHEKEQQLALNSLHQPVISELSPAALQLETLRSRRRGEEHFAHAHINQVILWAAESVKLYLPWSSVVMTVFDVDSLVSNNTVIFLQWMHSWHFFLLCLPTSTALVGSSNLWDFYPLSSLIKLSSQAQKLFRRDWLALAQTVWSPKLPFLRKLGYQPSNEVKKSHPASKEDLNTRKKEGRWERKVKLFWREKNRCLVVAELSHTQGASLGETCRRKYSPGDGKFSHENW